jgi:hypothetical protein
VYSHYASTSKSPHRIQPQKGEHPHATQETFEIKEARQESESEAGQKKIQQKEKRDRSRPNDAADSRWI